MRTIHLEFETSLRVDDTIAWAHATSLAGIDGELPWPLQLRTKPPVATIGEFLAAGSVRAELCAGPVRVLRWHPGIVELGERHFVEASTDMTWMRSWRHERTVATDGDGISTLSDLITFEPHLPGTGLVVRWLFRRRHRALHRALG